MGDPPNGSHPDQYYSTRFTGKIEEFDYFANIRIKWQISESRITIQVSIRVAMDLKNQTSGVVGSYRYRGWILVSIGMLISFCSYGQEYGLEFQAKPVSKDQRTKLDLHPEGYYSFRSDFEVAFSIQLRDAEPATFGYIARIVDDEGRNIDIIFNGPESHSLQVVYGQLLTDINIPDNDPDIYGKWTEIKLKYSLKDRTLHFDSGDTSILHRDIHFSGRIKIFFGKNDFHPVKTTDLPRMNIRDIRIYQRGQCLHHFPLDEMSGNIAADVVTKSNAIVENPVWIKPRFYHWGRSFDTYLSGLAVLCFEPGQEKVYMAGDELLKVYDVLKDSIENFEYSTRFTDLIRGSQLFFDAITNRLICYNLKIKTVHYFNFSELKWEEISNGPNITERFWFHNKYFSGPDSVLYTFGGYSQHKYYNLVQRYDFKNNEWDTVQTSGDVFYPRMHAAIGNAVDTIYILGGYGSREGDQILNPEHYTDLVAFLLNEKEFVKKYDFQAPLEGIDFASSMVISEEDRSYYVMATTIFEYDTYLQLLKGNLDDPELFPYGDQIPYKFHNEYSYSDLFFSETSQELISANSLADFDRNETKISVYKISYPPFVAYRVAGDKRNLLGRLVFIVLLFAVVTASSIILIRNIRRKKSYSDLSETGQKNEKERTSLLSRRSKFIERPEKSPNSILFFGGFQVINKHGNDITKKFTPLLKELFLLIFLYSIKDKGISVPRLTETLWFSMNAKTAKNNRAVNIAKLKNLISEIESCVLTSRTGYWQLEFNDKIVYNDYWSCIHMINREKSLSRKDLQKFLHAAHKGPLLGNASYEWLDEFKLECSNLIIDHLSEFIEQNDVASDHELLIQIADTILTFDILHEEAISMKCKALTALGKHSLAKEIFDKFSKEYSLLYDEPFNRTFTDIIKQ